MECCVYMYCGTAPNSSIQEYQERSAMSIYTTTPNNSIQVYQEQIAMFIYTTAPNSSIQEYQERSAMFIYMGQLLTTAYKCTKNRVLCLYIWDSS